MFNYPFYKRIQLWREFRKHLETSESPLEDCVDFWNQVPLVSIQADPFNENTWPHPWQLVYENTYCAFVKILAICYTLQLTDRFSQCDFEIHIVQDKELSQVNYLLLMDEWMIGHDITNVTSQSILPQSMQILKKQVMPKLH